MFFPSTIKTTSSNFSLVKRDTFASVYNYSLRYVGIPLDLYSKLVQLPLPSLSNFHEQVLSPKISALSKLRQNTDSTHYTAPKISIHFGEIDNKGCNIGPRVVGISCLSTRSIPPQACILYLHFAT